jgi:hypothetical protein
MSDDDEIKNGECSTLKRMLLTSKHDMARKSRRKSKYVNHTYVATAYNSDLDFDVDYDEPVDYETREIVENCNQDLLPSNLDYIDEIYANGDDEDTDEQVAHTHICQTESPDVAYCQHTDDIDGKLKRIESNQNMILAKLDSVLENLKYLNGNCLMKPNFNSFLKRVFDQSELLVRFFSLTLIMFSSFPRFARNRLKKTQDIVIQEKHCS